MHYARKEQPVTVNISELVRERNLDVGSSQTQYIFTSSSLLARLLLFMKPSITHI